MFSKSDQKQKTMIALFNYGGGMRGLIPAYIMSYIEERTSLHMSDMIDIFSGPSTGAILNGALTRPHPKYPEKPMFRARHMVKFYIREGKNIFPQDRFRSFRGMIHDFNNRTLKLGQLNSLFRYGHYDAINLARPLRTLYGDTKLSQSISSLIIPTYNIDGSKIGALDQTDVSEDTIAEQERRILDEGGHAVWLKHIMHDEPKGQKKRTPDVSMFDAVMASCAAPTYFPCHYFSVDYTDERGHKEYSAIDGNIFDNPCISYLGAIRRHVPADTRLIMIILGTGYTNKSVKKEDWNQFGSLGVVDPANDFPLINIFFHASESALMDSFEEEMGDNLFIFNKSIYKGMDAINSPDYEIDSASPENLERLKNFSSEMIAEQKDRLDALCDLLVTNYENKQKDKKGFSLF